MEQFEKIGMKTCLHSNTIKKETNSDCPMNKNVADKRRLKREKEKKKKQRIYAVAAISQAVN